MEDSLTIKGKITIIMPLEVGQTKAGKTFSMTSFAIETEGKYPKMVAFQDFGTGGISERKVGDEIIVSFDIESREYNGKFYTNLKAYKTVLVAAAPASEAPKQAKAPSEAKVSAPDLLKDDVKPPVGDDDLPF